MVLFLLGPIGCAIAQDYFNKIEFTGIATPAVGSPTQPVGVPDPQANPTAFTPSVTEQPVVAPVTPSNPTTITPTATIQPSVPVPPTPPTQQPPQAPVIGG